MPRINLLLEQNPLPCGISTGPGASISTGPGAWAAISLHFCWRRPSSWVSVGTWQVTDTLAIVPRRDGDDAIGASLLLGLYVFSQQPSRLAQNQPAALGRGAMHTRAKEVSRACLRLLPVEWIPWDGRSESWHSGCLVFQESVVPARSASLGIQIFPHTPLHSLPSSFPRRTSALYLPIAQHRSDYLVTIEICI